MFWKLVSGSDMHGFGCLSAGLCCHVLRWSVSGFRLGLYKHMYKVRIGYIILGLGGELRFVCI